MIEISMSGIEVEGGGTGSEFFSKLSRLGDVEGIVRGAAAVAFAPARVRAFLANDPEVALAAAMGLSVEDYRAEMERQAVLSQFGTLMSAMGQAMGQIMEDIAPIMEELMEEQPRRGSGFVLVEGSDTWLPRGLYEGRRGAEWLAARRPQRGPWPGHRPKLAGGWDAAGRRSARRRR